MFIWLVFQAKKNKNKKKKKWDESKELSLTVRKGECHQRLQFCCNFIHCYIAFIVCDVLLTRSILHLWAVASTTVRAITIPQTKNEGKISVLPERRQFGVVLSRRRTWNYRICGLDGNLSKQQLTFSFLCLLRQGSFQYSYRGPRPYYTSWNKLKIVAILLPFLLFLFVCVCDVFLSVVAVVIAKTEIESNIEFKL